MGIITDTLLLRNPVLGSEVNTMTENEITETLDVTGENCPMPVVKTKQTIDDLADGEVLEVRATDPGSMSDIAGWADTTGGVELVTQEEGDDVFTHYVRKTE
jgi:TusA-related sulfurtransferase